MRPARSPASSRGAITACSSPPCRRRSGGWSCSATWTRTSVCHRDDAALGPQPGVAGRRRATQPARSRLSLVEFRLELGLPVWRYEGDGIRHREARADAVSAEHRPPDLPAARGGRPRCGSSCGRSCTSATTRARSARRCRTRTRSRRSKAGSRCTPASDLPPLRLLMLRRPVGADARAARSCPTAISKNSRAATSIDGTAVEPGLLSRSISASRSSQRRRSSRRPNRGRLVEALTPSAAFDAETSRAAPACSSRRRPRRGPACAAELVLAADQFHHHAGGPSRRRDARRRARNRSAHGDRRLSLVHRLGTRHDDQPRGADAGDRPRIARPR